MLRELLLLPLVLLLLLPMLSRPPRLLRDVRALIWWKLVLLLLLLLVVVVGVRLMVAPRTPVPSGVEALADSSGVGVIVVSGVQRVLASALLVSRWTLRWPIGWTIGRNARPRTACSGGGACCPPPRGSLARRQVERAAGNYR